MSITVRDAGDADIPQIAAIYAFHVERDTASFELEAPDTAEMHRRYRDNVTRGYPYLVALSTDARVVGYAYASEYRSRPAYRHTVEDSVYVDAAWSRRGIGNALLNALIERCEAGGYRQMVAIIGGSHNTASIALHATLGFERVGVLAAVGRKFDRWLDTVLMQRALGPGAGAPPT
jgi:L-amino acid N-acyltransferase YncA